MIILLLFLLNAALSIGTILLLITPLVMMKNYLMRNRQYNVNVEKARAYLRSKQ